MLLLNIFHLFTYLLFDPADCNVDATQNYTFSCSNLKSINVCNKTFNNKFIAGTDLVTSFHVKSCAYIFAKPSNLKSQEYALDVARIVNYSGLHYLQFLKNFENIAYNYICNSVNPYQFPY